MSSRTAILIAVSIVALFLLVAAALVWPQWQPRGLVLRDNAQNARASSNREIDNEPAAAPNKHRRPKPSTVIAGSPKPVEPARPPFDMSTLEENDVLVRAQVKLTSPHGLDIFRMAEREPWTLVVRYMERPDFKMHADFDGDAAGRIECAYSRDALPIEEGKLWSGGTWSARISWSETEAFVPIATPKLEGRVLDFGTLELDLTAALGDQEWLFIGRLMHATGLPIFGLETLSLKIGAEEQLWFEQHEDGRFACSFWGDFDASMRLWLVHSCDEDETLQALTKPAIQGRIVDLGDIIVNCAAVEVRLDAWPDKEMRRQRHGLEATFEPPEIFAYVYLSSIIFSTDIALTAPETVKVGFAMPGPYRWSMDQSDSTLAFAESGGELMLEAGKLTRIDISFVPVHNVLVRFKAAGELGHIQFEAQYIGEDGEPNEWFSSQISASSALLAVENPNRQKMKFTAKTRGWAAVEYDVAPQTTELTIEFTERMAATTGILLVELPGLPDFFKDHSIEIGIMVEVGDGETRRRLHLASYNQDSMFWGLTDEAGLLRFEIEKGKAKVWLQEVSQIYGYPRGMISGPVECTITVDAPCKVKLPQFEAPPWTVAAQSTLARLTCEGVPLNYAGPLLQGEDSQIYSLQYGSQQRMSAGDYAIPDGTLLHPLQMTLPTEQRPTLLFEYDFAACIEVRVRRGKALVPCQIRVSATLCNGTTSTSATSQENGKLRTWAPRGEVRLTVELLGGQMTVSRAVVVGTDLLVVEFAVEGAYAQFNWDERYQTEDGSHWWLRDAKGELVNSLYSNVRSLKLEPGTYTLTPENAIKPEISFVIAESNDITVEVPFVARMNYTGSFMVKYPKDLKPDPDGYGVEWSWYVPLTGDAAQDVKNREWASEEGWMRSTVEGIKFGDLPANQEFVLVLAVGALNEGGDLAPLAWAALPMRLTLKGGEMETIAVEWKRAVVLNHEWFEWGDFHWIGPDNYGMRYTQYNRILLPGSYSAVYLASEAPKTFAVTLKLEQDKFFEMPPDVKKAIGGEEDTGEEDDE